MIGAILGPSGLPIATPVAPPWTF